MAAFFTMQPYRYSGISHLGSGWRSELFAIKPQAEFAAGTPFNSVLLNLYCDRPLDRFSDRTSLVKCFTVKQTMHATRLMYHDSSR